MHPVAIVGPSLAAARGIGAMLSMATTMFTRCGTWVLPE
jgi:hypothetical protein